jgi:FkbM family methyltransferase
MSLLDALVATCRPNVIFDVGAHVGTWTLLSKSILPEATIHAFEPLPHHVDELERNIATLSGVYVHKIGLGSHRHVAEMRITNRSDASSILELTAHAEVTYGLSEVKLLAIQVETIDGLIEKGAAPLPDLIKLDVQGFEIEVLRGAQYALRRCAWVICEVSFEEYYAGQPLFHDVAKLMGECGFRVHAFSHATPLGARLTQTDVLFSNKNL